MKNKNAQAGMSARRGAGIDVIGINQQWRLENANSSITQWLIRSLCRALPVMICLWGHAARSVEFGGTISYTGSKSNHFSKVFRADVSANLWRIDTWSTDAPGVTNVVGFDGTNIYKVIHYDNPPTRYPGYEKGQNPSTKSRVPPKNQATVAVIQGDMPDGDESFAAPVWLMLASGQVLDNSGGTGRLKAVWPTVLSSSSNFLEATWEKDPRPPLLPTRVTFHHPGYFLSWDRVLLTNRIIRMDPPYEKGYMQALFQASDFRTEAGIAFPTKARLEQFARKETAATDADLRLLTTTEIAVTNISESGWFSAAMIPSNSVVVDRRLVVGTSDGIPIFYNYFSTNGNIPDPAAVKTTPDFKITTAIVAARSDIVPAAPNAKVWFIRVVLILVAIGPAVYWALKLMKQTRNRKL